MNFAAVVDRARAEFLEMPGMELTLPQAIRLWNLGLDDCRAVIDELVDTGFLRWTARRTVMRTGSGSPPELTSNILVRRGASASKSVGRPAAVGVR
jgi:hypothetical protein